MGNYSDNPLSSRGGLRGQSPVEERLNKHWKPIHAIVTPNDFPGDSSENTGDSLPSEVFGQHIER
jgi:hypothetical protein